MFPNITPEQKEFVSNIATMKDGKIGIDLPKDVAAKLGGGIKQGFVALDNLNSGQLEQLAKIEEELANTKPEDIARQQFNAVTQIKDILTAFYLNAGAKVQYETEAGTKIMQGNREASNIMSEKYKETNGDLVKLLDASIRKGFIEDYGGKIGIDTKKYDDEFQKNLELMKASYSDNKQTQTKPAEDTTKTIDFNHNITLKSDNIMEPLNRDIIRNTHVFDKWAERNIGEYTTAPKP